MIKPTPYCPRCGRKLTQPPEDPNDLQGHVIPYNCKKSHFFVVYEDYVTHNMQLVEKQGP